MFHERLNEIRTKQGYTAQQMADILGVSLRAYRFYEAGSREPNIESLVKIADTLNVSLDYLLCRNFHEDTSGEP